MFSSKKVQKSKTPTILTGQEFKREYETLFNQLRIAAKNNDIDEIKRIKNLLNPEHFQTLIENKNSDYSDCAIIHYAVKYNHPKAIEALTEHLSLSERFKIFSIKYRTGCHSLHFAATVNDSDHSSCSYEAAATIKNLLYKSDNHSFWVSLLSKQQVRRETPVHYAAGQQSPKLLKLFSDDLHVEEWINILSIKDKNGYTAIELYFREHLQRIQRTNSLENSFVKALRGPLTDDLWVNFLLKHNILHKLDSQFRHFYGVFQSCIRELTHELSVTSMNRLMIAFEATKCDTSWSSSVGIAFFQANKTNPLAAECFPNLLRSVKAFL